MRKIFMVALIFVFSLATACRSGDRVEEDIERNLNEIIENEKVSFSGNPNEYIQANPRSYEDIVKKGNAGLAYLTKKLKESDQNGLKEWIMAKACADILQDRNPVNEWSTGKEWIAKHEEKRSRPS